MVDIDLSFGKPKDQFKALPLNLTLHISVRILD
jgi:hypothetical protein